MDELSSEDQRHLDHASGWLGLGNHLEANAALDRITPAMRARPAVLELRYKVFAIGQQWEGAAEIARAMREQDPDSAFGYPGDWCACRWASARQLACGIY